MSPKTARKKGSARRILHETNYPSSMKPNSTREQPGDGKRKGKGGAGCNDGMNATTDTIDDTAATAGVATSASVGITVPLTSIDVYARLTYPLVRPPLEDKSFEKYVGEEEEERYSVELKFSPRFYFASNLCLICMERSRIVCEVCEMVSFCSAKHRKQGSKKHGDLCEFLAEIRRAMKNNPVLPSANHYRAYRVNSLEILHARVGRPLELWEKEIVLYPRACRICSDLSGNLKSCARCAMEFFCDNHEKEHERWCREFLVFRRCLLMQHRHGHASPLLPSTVEASSLPLPESLDRLLLRAYSGSRYFREMDSYTYAMLSQLSTIPLTALYSMQLAYKDWEVRTDFAIHVIGAEFQFECVNLEGWERLFVHFLPNLRRLSVKFVGPELRLPDGLPLELLTETRVCGTCKASGKTVNFSFHAGKFYHEFIREGRPVESPDLVCLFNPGLYRETAFQGKDTWPETIREFCRFRVPVSLTSYTAEEIPRDLRRLEAIADVETLLHPRRNPFASVKPDRNFVSDDVAPLIYKNYYLAIVRGK